MSIEFRPLIRSDQEQLWNWLHIALWDPPPAALRPRSVLQDPGVRIYAEYWGMPGDVGVVAVVSGQEAGACWMRLLPEGTGLAYVDQQTPQLGIALESPFQHQGLGRPMMMAALEAAWQHGYQQVSLTVHPQNPAIALYRKCGFQFRETRRDYWLMVAQAEGQVSGL
ncbi:GNAT family N-acetyltransferase [Gynuella sunshinyii]|uniref:Acetyltransferase n=1 Tax=Gynuella sunshinyii YC6258 TaxID=1445510 RepID=A0A0C5VF99_9GAMM|nr:GNAT family N-acetyltransferase [Gynuella sunshinyii]AJQ97945.1 acetyltransferase [Gynuella sunshinyii YC6258]